MVMASAILRPGSLQNQRKRRTHAKSRKGCVNCKIRRIKCDEAHPQCHKCLSYGVSCTYGATGSMLDINAHGAFRVEFTNSYSELPSPPPAKKRRSSPTCRSETRITSPTNIANQPSNIQTTLSILNNILMQELDNIGPCLPTEEVRGWLYTPTDLEILQRFQNRTIKTIGSVKSQPSMRKHVVPMAFRYPFLMRMILSLTLLHDSYLAASSASSPPNYAYPTNELSKKYTTTSLHHWTAASALFNAVLSKPIEPDSRDALWATATLVGTLVFAYVEAEKAEESWPLKTSSHTEPSLMSSSGNYDGKVGNLGSGSDLSWVHLSEGKKAIWTIAQPTRPDSVFYQATTDRFHPGDNSLVATWILEDDFSAVPLHILRFFNVSTDTERSTVQSNPYHLPLLLLSHLQYLAPATQNNLMVFLNFLAYMTPEFKALLEQKDHRAIVLLAWWFGMLENTKIWWLGRRAKLEGEACRKWLGREGAAGRLRMSDSQGVGMDTIVGEKGCLGLDEWMGKKIEEAWGCTPQ